MSRKPLTGQLFKGSKDRAYKGPWSIDNKPVNRGVFVRAHDKAIGRREHPSYSLERVRGARGRKRALDARHVWEGCEHEFEYCEDTIGADDVINGTYTERWLQCACGAQRGATWEDAPSYDDDY